MFISGWGVRARLQSMMEETDLRIAETKKDTYEFKRDIVVGAENFRTGKAFGVGGMPAPPWIVLVM